MIYPLHSPPKPKRICVYDLEWYPTTYRFRLGGVYDGEEYRAHTTVSDLLDDLLSDRMRNAYTYAHAGGLADIQFLLGEMARRSDRLRATGTFAGSALVVLKVNGTHTLLDSLWTLRAPLRKIGESVGLAKLGEDYRCPSCDHHPGECIFYAPISVLTEYNERDCVVLWTAMTRLQQELEALGGQLRATAASTALDLYRRKFLQTSIRTSSFLNCSAGRAYIASRVERFRDVAGPGTAFFDVNSSFPYSMTLPTPGQALGTAKTWDETDELALVRATVTVPDQYVPPLAYRADDGRVYHPTGTWRGSFFGVDLQALLASGGRIERVRSATKFERRTELADYVREIYALRRASTDPFQRDVYKLLMNALYGKFAERGTKTKLVLHPKKVPDRGRQVAPGVWCVDEDRYIEHAHVPASAVITARSRQLLGTHLRAAAEQGRIWYADTDSIVTDADLPTGSELGDLKRERVVEREAVFVRPKLYRVDEHVKAKGFPRMSVEKFEELRAGGFVEYDRMLRVREQLGMGIFEPGEVRVQKRLRNTTREKRCGVGDGNTRAWTVDELQED